MSDNLFTELRKDFKKREFKRYHSDRYLRVKKSWRAPRGLDNRMRKKYSGTPIMPNKRFRKPVILRDILPNGCREVIVRNLDELQAVASLNSNNQSKVPYCATISGATGSKKRIEIVNEAKVMGITLTNGEARLAVEVPE